MKNLKSKNRVKDNIIFLVKYVFGIYSSVSILLPVLLLFAYAALSIQWVVGQYYYYAVGQPSPQNYIALSEMRYTDRVAVERLRSLAEQHIVAVVVKDGETKQEFGVAMQMLNNISDKTESVPIKNFPQELFSAIKNIPEAERNRILSYVEEIGDSLSEASKDEGKTEIMADFMNHSEYLWREVDKLSLSPDIANIVYQILNNLVGNNVKTDEQLTQEYRSQQGGNVPNIERRVEVGDTIVEKGEVITPQIAVLLRSQGYIGRELPLSSFIFCSVLIFLLPFWFNIFVQRERTRRRPLPWPFISLIIGMSWLLEMLGNYFDVIGIGSWFLITSSYITLPRYIAFCVSLSGSFIATFLMIGTSYRNIGLLLFMSIISSISAYYIMIDLVSRRKIMHQSIFLGCVYITVEIIARWVMNMPYTWLISIKLFGFGMVLSFLFSLSLSFIEGVMGITTPMRLREICHPSVPLLKKLQIEVPGTYQHALTLGSLAEMVAEELSLDGNLMKAGAYYHDIGKLKRPLYYVENQLNVGNIQDTLSPPLSAVTIIAHVKEGLELAVEYGLPAVVRDFIAEHHGTTFLGYFYKKALAEGLNVSEEQFCYPGPKPQSRETALLMLLDSMEAGMRSASQNIFSVTDVEKVIDRVFEMKLNEGQLDDVSFTFHDMAKIKEVMLKSFQSMYHTRKIKELQDKTQRS